MAAIEHVFYERDGTVDLKESGWNGPGWYFWDEPGARCHGPLPTQHAAIAAMYARLRRETLLPNERPYDNPWEVLGITLVCFGGPIALVWAFFGFMRWIAQR